MPLRGACKQCSWLLEHVVAGGCSPLPLPPSCLFSPPFRHHLLLIYLLCPSSHSLYIITNTSASLFFPIPYSLPSFHQLSTSSLLHLILAASLASSPSPPSPARPYVHAASHTESFSALTHYSVGSLQKESFESSRSHTYIKIDCEGPPPLPPSLPLPVC